MTGHPPIPTRRDDITGELRRCATARADAQNAVLDDLARIDALSQRIDDLMDALTAAGPT